MQISVNKSFSNDTFCANVVRYATLNRKYAHLCTRIFMMYLRLCARGLTSVVRDSGTGTRSDGLRNGLTQAVRYTKSYNLRCGAIIIFLLCHKGAINYVLHNSIHFKRYYVISLLRYYDRIYFEITCP